MKLTTKLFFAFLLSCIIIVALMTGIMHYYATRNFSSYIRDVEIKRMSDIIVKLESEYRKYGSWEHIRKNPVIWEDILHSTIPFHKMKTPLPDSPDEEPFAGIPPEHEFHFHHHPPGIPDNDSFMEPPDMFPRQILFDTHKNPIFGNEGPAKDCILKAVNVDGKTVGWLGLNLPERISDPLQLKFLYRQGRAFVAIGIGILLLATLVSLLLSRHILLPVKKLAEGAHALASRRFDVRIDVHSTDELGQLSRDFNHMADTLERYESMRRQWLNDISHELRTPLAVMRAEIEAAQDGVREMNTDTLQSLHSEVMLLSRVIDDLHSLSVFDSEMLSMKKEDINPVKVLRNVITAFTSRFEQAGIKILPVPDERPDIFIMGDSERLAQVFSNILENTLKYTDSPGALRVSLSLDDVNLHIIFEDSSPEVPDESLPFLFERLYKTDASRSRQKGGSGLGLSICKSIVEAMNGGISAGESELGGLKIDVTLPVSDKS